jgi:hypothetical protein
VIIGTAPAARPTVGASTVVGRCGRFTWHDYPAADVHVWTVTRSALQDGGRRWSLRGRLSHVNAYNLAQQPLILVVPHRRGAWYWPVVSLWVQDDRCQAALGEPITPATVAQTARVQQGMTRGDDVARTALARLIDQQRLVR